VKKIGIEKKIERETEIGIGIEIGKETAIAKRKEKKVEAEVGLDRLGIVKIEENQDRFLARRHQF
jgi:hypothetical protein